MKADINYKMWFFVVWKGLKLNYVIKFPCEVHAVPSPSFVWAELLK